MVDKSSIPSLFRTPYRIKRVTALLLAGSIFSTPILASTTSETAETAIFIKGSNTIGAVLAPLLIKSFLHQAPTTNIKETRDSHSGESLFRAKTSNGTLTFSLEAHGSSTGFAGLENATATIAASSRAIKPSEKEKLQHLGDLSSKNGEHIIAIDGIAVLVHPANPINRLSTDQLTQIFSGKITNWQEVGGLNAPIHLYARDENSGTWDTFKHLILGKLPLASQTKRYESNDQLSDDVSQDSLGIGFTGIASVRHAKALAIQEGKATPLLPTRENIATEDYPLARRLYFYTATHGIPQPATDFIAFCESAEGQKIVEAAGFVSQNIQSFPALHSEQTPLSFRSMTEGYERLSVNFRFRKGRTTLDNKALADIPRLKDFITSNEIASKDLMLIGYADKSTHELRAQMISELRANTVKTTLKSDGIEIKAVTGYGEYMPVTTKAAHTEQSRNGRVEVWLKRKENDPLLAMPALAAQ
ncbi:MAG: substrate-binding domain-containing protein [Hahellaceae bacterium]|nr:substrate-binding domain-containing protein [Hahellaceae bacterium]MCP5169870.1 substrate-binding domain-containing protein [Hahellaceae bacterium]